MVLVETLNPAQSINSQNCKKGIPTCFIRWVRGFLSHRKAFVAWQGASSCKRIFSEGLPQGSVLAPLIWLIYMDDLLDSNPQCSLAFVFADDTTYAAQGCSLLECETALQPAADLLHSWCSTWKVSLSTSKSVVSYFSLDPRETTGKAQPVIYFGPDKVPFEITPRLLGVIRPFSVIAVEQQRHLVLDCCVIS